MDIQKIEQYKSTFDAIVEIVKDEDGNDIEVWYARELQTVLGYAKWERFVGAIERAIEACKSTGVNVDDHFREVTKMVQLGSGSQREVQDFMLMRYAWCCQRWEEYAKGHIKTSKEMRNKSTRLCKKSTRVLTN